MPGRTSGRLDTLTPSAMATSSRTRDPNGTSHSMKIPPLVGQRFQGRQVALRGNPPLSCGLALRSWGNREQLWLERSRIQPGQADLATGLWPARHVDDSPEQGRRPWRPRRSAAHLQQRVLEGGHAQADVDHLTEHARDLVDRGGKAERVEQFVTDDQSVESAR